MKEFVLIFFLILSPFIIKDSTVDLINVPVLFIGDSHTSNHSWGWQVILKNKTKLKLHNTSIVGKHLPYMLSVAKKTITPYFKYCFVYGGVNDLYGKRDPYLVFKDVQKIVNICKQNNVQCVIITGVSPNCIKPLKDGKLFFKNYSKYQQLLTDSIVGAKVISITTVNTNDCYDWVCHMNQSGHKKIANTVIEKMNFKIY
jgi:hypothetical protein